MNIDLRSLSPAYPPFTTIFPKHFGRPYGWPQAASPQVEWTLTIGIFPFTTVGTPFTTLRSIFSITLRLKASPLLLQYASLHIVVGGTITFDIIISFLVL